MPLVNSPSGNTAPRTALPVLSSWLRAFVVAVLVGIAASCGGLDESQPDAGDSAASGDEVLESCRLPVADKRGDVAIGGWPRIEYRMKSVGEVRAVVVMVDFPDAPAEMSPQAAFAMLADSSGIFDEVSYGRLKYELLPQFRWYRMSRPSTDYAPLNESFEGHRKYVAEAIALADADVDFSEADSFVILANPDAEGLGNAGPAFTPISMGEGIPVDGTTLLNGATSAYDINFWGAIWLNHEITHALGLVDLYAFEGNEQFPYTGEFSYMGLSSLESSAPGLLAWERWVLGWIDDKQVLCLESPPASAVTARLTPVATIGGPKMVVVAIGKTRAVVIEARRPVGLDGKLRKAGVLVYTVDTSVESGMGPVRVVPADPIDPKVGYTTFFDAPRALGESIIVEGVKVTTVGEDADGFDVEIALG